ncbi:hypothetical protein NDU88_001860 [Pleurodeles waltl]|uniref:Uncharacterized protein n=1 Tax=Pleurodeles waltl TaxID=8319 RepID=A0AAV7P576_PLEWA|nr:hypothetical protein NDU88_001860 [Pleurodeles waltl]
MHRRADATWEPMPRAPVLLGGPQGLTETVWPEGETHIPYAGEEAEPGRVVHRRREELPGPPVEQVRAAKRRGGRKGGEPRHLARVRRAWSWRGSEGQSGVCCCPGGVCPVGRRVMRALPGECMARHESTVAG